MYIYIYIYKKSETKFRNHDSHLFRSMRKIFNCPNYWIFSLYERISSEVGFLQHLKWFHLYDRLRSGGNHRIDLYLEISDVENIVNLNTINNTNKY